MAQTAENIKILTLHPSVGKLIDVKEKKDFYLFPEYKDSLFESAEILKYNDSTYTIRFKTTSGTVFEKPTSIHELDAMYAKVDSKRPAEYVEPEKYREVRKNKDGRDNSQLGLHIGNVIFQVVLITLSILIQASY